MKKSKKERITKLVWYFTIFSVIGLIIETVYCFITCNGVIESRKGLLIGPFCPVYGIGAIVIIDLLSRFNKKPIKLFILGTILGAVIEYTLSYGLEVMYGSKFWDYSYMDLNINGRICLIYSAFWGVLSIILIDYIKPAIDHFINKINPQKGKKIEIALIIFFIINSIITIIAISTYTQIAKDRYKEMGESAIIQKQETNTQEQEDIENSEENSEEQEDDNQEQGQDNQEQENRNEQEENKQNNQESNIFYNKIMPKIFPNIRIKGQNGEGIWVRDIMEY